MTSPERPPDWPDIELVVMQGLRPLLPGVRIADEVPPRVETLLPVVTVQAAPGGGYDRITGTAALDVSAMAATRGAMWTLARRVRAALHTLPGTGPGGHRIDTVTGDWPVEIPYGNPGLRRAIATYAVTLRATDT
ncbi:hypothetical protein [Streptomyces uncialis]|uniref:hypothetical protein n=1 Tax=Streptomyces uncialis TaxID=1048205 RepID=UPI00224CB2C2|nr:hypothetical protein [Streptomyces uncialis]MCX4661500.1 DUF3168 domain-containing protein [Streptomyces uncialis]